MNIATDDDATAQAILLARQALYRFTALTLLDPKYNSWERLEALRQNPLSYEAAALLRDLSEAQPKTLGLGERGLLDLVPERVLSLLPDSSDHLNEQFEHAFGLLVSNACPPYETEYINSKFSFQRSNTLADVSGFYRAFGLITSSVHPERPDHIVQELEFMAFLVGLERLALEHHASDAELKQEICRDAQRRFLRDHLSWWAPAFAKLLAREAADGFYAAAAAFLAALIPAERALLHVEPGIQKVEPSPLEAPEACEGCELAN